MVWGGAFRELIVFECVWRMEVARFMAWILVATGSIASVSTLCCQGTGSCSTPGTADVHVVGGIRSLD